MRQKISVWLLLFFFVFTSKKTFSIQRHLEKSDYPYGLLGNDFGILNAEDLAVNTCRVKPMPFNGEKFKDYLYWQCFETKKTKLICSGYSYFIDFGTFVTLIVMTAKKQDTYYEYLSRKVVSMQSCREYKKDFKNLTKNEKYVCISGMYNEQDKNSAGRMVSYWIFDKFKTKKGCKPYFYGDCSLNYQIKKGCDPNKYTKQMHDNLK
ncbi:MAG: hypothetical protein V4591_09555 [Bdellovibrionota bacterium]